MPVLPSLSGLIGLLDRSFRREPASVHRQAAGAFSGPALATQSSAHRRIAAPWTRMRLFEPAEAGTRKQARGCRLRAASGALFLSLLAVPALPGDAQSDVVHYDPSQCATDPEGTVTIALGRIVLRVPMDELSSIGDLPPHERAIAPVPPDPSQPEGCPDHPMVGRSFYFQYLLDAVQENQPPHEPFPRRIDRLLLISVTQDYWGMQPFWEHRFERVCINHQLRSVVENGFVVCRVRSSRIGTPPEHWPFYVQAPLDVYAAPFGQPFTVGCIRGSIPGTHQCNVDYKLYGTLNLTYRFEPGRLPITDLIDFDRELRAWVESMRVQDFVWADERNANGDE